MSHPEPATYAAAAAAFRRFFGELRETYLERETLFTQVELALLCREHVLAIGPPGTAKSEIASMVLSRIVDERTRAPSLFAKQLSESTVQADLIGPVDFKVLTETGRTEYITDDGMLGATYAFLDEVFDGRDMLLRSILNVLYERELKHGKRLTAGRLDCAIMTSNRYLSEVLARSPELLLAFADRLSFICFIPKSFARNTSRAAMLVRSAHRRRPELRCALTLQQLAALQETVEQVHLPSLVLEGLEMLADELERALQTQVSKLPDYAPTKYFSQRSTVKALWALKAAVVRDKLYRHPERSLEVTEKDLDVLRYFFLLGGPPAAETEALLKIAVDPRERAQLEIVRLEQRVFDEVLEKVRAQLATGVEREAGALKAADDLTAAEAMARSYQPSTVSTTAAALKEKLVPGPRHPQNRQVLLSAARSLLSATEQRLARGMAGTGEGRAGLAVLGSFSEALELARAVPELVERVPALCAAITEFCSQALEMIGLSAESTEFEGAVRLDNLTGVANGIAEELNRIRELQAVMSALLPELGEVLRQREAATRDRVVASLRRRATTSFQSAHGRKADPYDALVQDARKLAQLERALAVLTPERPGLREELLGPLGAAYAREVLASTPFTRIDQLARAFQSLVEHLRREGIPLEPALAQSQEILEARLEAHAQTLTRGVKERSLPPPTALNGDAYVAYRGEMSGTASPDGELTALVGLEGQLAALRNGSARMLSNAVKDAVASAELSYLQARVGYLRSWLTQLLAALPAPDGLSNRADAEKAFDRLVKSRFPMLAMKEGELLKLEGALSALGRQGGELGKAAKALTDVLRGINSDFQTFSKRLLQVRAAL